MRLALGALAPVGDGPRDEEFPLGQRPDLSSCGGAGGLPPRFAGRTFGLPVAADPLRCPLAALLVAEALRPGHVMDPGRDRAFGDSEFGGDPVVVVALLAQAPGLGMKIVLCVGTTRPLWRRLAREQVVQSRIAADLEDFLDLSAGFAARRNAIACARRLSTGLVEFIFEYYWPLPTELAYPPVPRAC